MYDRKLTLEEYRIKVKELKPVADKVKRAINYALEYGIRDDWTDLNTVKILTNNNIQIRMSNKHVFISDFKGLDVQLKVSECKFEWLMSTHIRYGMVLDIYPSGEQSTENIRIPIADIKYIGFISHDMLEYEKLYASDD